MEKFNQGDNVLLGNRHPRSFENTESSRQRTSDTDFNDVFGGPPRRYSMQEMKMRYSFNETVVDSEDNNTVFSTSLIEKPVFGEESARKRYVTNDFFDDIFKGDESYTSPRRSDRDPMASGSTPGSRVLSPERPFPPPEAEIFGTSPPVQFSLPANLTTTMDSSNLTQDEFSNENSNLQTSKGTFSKFLSRSSSGGKKETRNYRQSPLSREISFSGEEELPMDGINNKGEKLKEDTGYVESLVDGSHFHFSIYKWPGGGVPLMASLRVGKSSKSKNENISSSKGSVQSIDLEDERTEYVNKDSVSRNAQPMSSEVERKKNDKEKEINQQETESHIEVSESKISEGIKISSVLADEHEMNTLRAMISENVDAKGNSIEESGSASKKVLKEKKNDAKRKSKNKESVKKDNLPGSPMKNTSLRSGVKGKVTEFVKIFNQESTRKSKIDVDTRNQSSRSKNTESEVTNVQKMNEKVEESKVDNIPKAFSKVNETPNEDRVKQPSNVKVDEDPNKERVKQTSNIKVDENPMTDRTKQSSNVKTSDQRSSGFSDKKSASSFHGSSHGTSKATSENSEDHDGFTVEEISQDEEKGSQTSGDPEEIRASDAKIQQWSNGRKGNIRSLLSTLQLVLWPESGWKPVPLVNIIEGSAVKRAYQRALLCLHPDKLQQKDASFLQKYIAEKVFDILQEAWDHYNTLGAI